MAPRPQLSLCVHVSADRDLIQEFSENVIGFFQKFPLLYEVLFAVNPGQDQSLSLLRYLAERNPHYKIVENKKHLSRAQNLENLCKESRGDILITTDLDLAAPLSEIFKMLEVFYSERETEVVFGDRTKAKKKLETTEAEEIPLETFFSGVIREKTAWPYQDLFCPILGIRKSAFEKIQNDLKSSGWHWNHEVQRVVHRLQLKSREVPLYVGSRKIQKPPKTEALQLLKFVLFRI
ncbi:glycosyltransferase [Bdellovibrio sp. HCB337]|uniref:glycosyltransferase n=1 Tax=Bdellovibrio sp. HCB337 TaxID=3394358 RepID=UPI0039A6C6F9